MLRALLLFISILLFYCCLAQDTTFYYTDYLGKIVTQKDSAFSVRFVISPAKGSGSYLYNIQDFYMNGRPKLLAQSKDSLGMNLQGACIEYFSAGQKKRFYTINNKHFVGDIIYYYPNGNIYLLKREDPKTSNIYLYECRDQEGNVLFQNGTGDVLSFNPFSEIFTHWTFKERYRDYLKEGTSEKYVILESDTLHVFMNYERDVLKSGISYSNTGKQYPFDVESKQLSCKKGNYWLMRHIRSNLREVPYSESNMWVTVDMFVRSNGIVEDVRIADSEAGVILNPKVINALRRSDLWVLGSKYGRPISTKVIVDIDMRNFKYFFRTETLERLPY